MKQVPKRPSAPLRVIGTAEVDQREGKAARPVVPAAVQLPVVATYDVEQHLLVRTAWLYFAGGITQDGIARQLGLTRARVNRLIADARAKGIVQISINSPLASAVALESELAKRFGLQQVVIVPSPGDDDALPGLIGAAAGAVFGGHIRDGMSVGVGWGRTLRISLQSIPRRTRVDLTVVSLIGGLTRSSAINTYETASHLAELFSAECTYIAGPAYCDSEASRDVLQSQSIVREALERARRADLALVSVGSVEPDATMVKLGLITRADQASLVRAGAVGDLGSHWIDEYGRLVDHPLNRRAVALSLEELARIPKVILASGGLHKVKAMHGALVLGAIDVLVTDEVTAAGVLEMSKRLAGRR